jgi:hypothetical protein
VMSTLGAAAWHLAAAVAGILIGHPIARPARVLIGVAIVPSSRCLPALVPYWSHFFYRCWLRYRSWRAAPRIATQVGSSR